MAYQRDGYFYNEQMKSYIRQFMAIFTGLQVQIGKWNTLDERLISVPVHYAHQDRVVASILAENVQNKPLRLPLMSVYMGDLQLNKDYMAGSGAQRRETYVPTGGLVPNDMRVIHQRRPTPYLLTLTLSLYASNTDQHFQMLEQILPYFTPTLQVQVSDSNFDWKRLSILELKQMQLDTNDPIGTDKRITKSNLTFEMPVWFDVPVEVRDDFVQKVFLRIGAVSTGDTTSYEIVADLDAQGIPYELVLDDTDLKIDP